MRIAHVSDVHVRTMKRHDEYRAVFANLYRDLRENVKPDLIIDTGDLAHTKTQISPELIDMLVEYHRELSSIAPVVRILGNHDVNLMNPDRQDAISPVIDSLRGSTKHSITLMKKSGKMKIAPGFYVWAYSMVDEENYPTVAGTSTRDDENDVHIAMFHGSIANCVTDQDWKMTSAEHDVTIFGGCDYALMGDIHKQQFFGNERRIGYAGSLIQQNFGESTEKGYLVWDIKSRREHTVEFRRLFGAREFHTVILNDDGTVPRTPVPPPDSRLRIMSKQSLSLVQQKKVEREVRDLFLPRDVISVTSPDNSFVKKRDHVAALKDLEDVRSLEVQDRLMREFLKTKSLSDDVLSSVAELNKKYQQEIESNEDVVRNVFWRVNKLGWTNMFNYGEDNFIDFAKIPGLTGVFAPNTAGKSSIFEIFMEALFDKVTKDVSKNIELVNDNRDTAKMVVDLTVGDESYVIERTIEKIKYGKGEIKEWGKTSLDFYSDDRVSLNGVSRPETEKMIRRRIGTFEDFVLTTISAQEPITGLPGGANLLMCKETDRKRILFRFLDLDIFDQKCVMAKEESKKFIARLRELEDQNVANDHEMFKSRLTESSEQIATIETSNEALSLHLRIIDKQMMDLSSQISKETFSYARWGAVQQRVSDLSTKVKSRRDKICAVSKEREVSVRELASIDSELARVLPTAAQDLLKFNELTVEIADLRRSNDMISGSLSGMRKSLRLLDEVPCGDSYPSCKFLVDAFAMKKEVPEEEKCLQNVTEKMKALEAEKELLKDSATCAKNLSSLERSKMKFERNVLENDRVLLDAERELSKFEEKLRETTRELHELDEAKIASLASDEATAELEKLKKSKRELTEQLSDNNKRLMSLSKQLGADTLMVQKLRTSVTELSELRKTCRAYECYTEAMGKHGIAYQILAEKLPVLNDEINKILSNVVDFSVSLEHDEQEQTMKLYLQYGDYRSRNLGLCSGAEKFISSLAIRAALLNISSLPKTNMFVVDEGFGKLDPTHLEAIQRMFDYLRSVFEHVIVISHVDTLKDMVDNCIEITADVDGYAHVEV